VALVDIPVEMTIDEWVAIILGWKWHGQLWSITENAEHTSDIVTYKHTYFLHWGHLIKYVQWQRTVKIPPIYA
jgi:hypothetical protein